MNNFSRAHHVNIGSANFFNAGLNIENNYLSGCSPNVQPLGPQIKSLLGGNPFGATALVLSPEYVRAGRNVNVNHHYHLYNNRTGSGQLAELQRESSSLLDNTLEKASEDGFVEVEMADIVVREDVSSKTFFVPVERTSNPFRPKVVKIRGTVQVAEIGGIAHEKFMLITLHSQDGEHTVESENRVWKLWRQIYDRYSSADRKAHLPQLYGLCRSPQPMLIFHEGWDDGFESNPFAF
ncbi:hypothetical protein L218DRAFT_1006488 [Marasmius fiardii PR-910]|nr:hypothetical protein L218DRAFT_1006488 [Marasmius fiardii PR-910]